MVTSKKCWKDLNPEQYPDNINSTAETGIEQNITVVDGWVDVHLVQFLIFSVNCSEIAAEDIFVKSIFSVSFFILRTGRIFFY